MTDIEKPAAIVADDMDEKKSQAMDVSQQDNAVGYKEFMEGRDLDISDKEVCTRKSYEIETTSDTIPAEYRIRDYDGSWTSPFYQCSWSHKRCNSWIKRR